MEKVESPAKVHVFYIDYGNVSTFASPGVLNISGTSLTSASQNTCISQVLFCCTTAGGRRVFVEGFLAPIQTPVVCLFPL